MATRPRLPASGKIPPPSGIGGPTSSPTKRPAPPTGVGSSFGSKSEPNKKKIKKNSGVGIGVPGASAGAGAEDETTTSMDGNGTKTFTSNAKTNNADTDADADANAEDDVAVPDFTGAVTKNHNNSEMDGAAVSDDIGADGGGLDDQNGKGNDGAAPLTNGTGVVGDDA